MYLSSRLSAAILPALLEPSVPVTPDDAVIESGTIHIPHGILRILPHIVSVLQLRGFSREFPFFFPCIKSNLGSRVQGFHSKNHPEIINSRNTLYRLSKCLFTSWSFPLDDLEWAVQRS